MDAGHTASLPEKLVLFLQKISNGNIYGVDESYLERLLSAISIQQDKEKLLFKEIIAWFMVNKDAWSAISINVTINCFLIELCGELCRKEDYLKQLTENDVLTVVMPFTLAEHNVSAVRCSYLKALKAFTYNNLGLQMIKNEKRWQVVIKTIVNDSSIYVRRYAQDFLRLLLKTEKTNLDLTKEVLVAILQPPLPMVGSCTDEEEELQIEKTFTPILKLLDALIDDNVKEKNANSVPQVLESEFNFSSLLKSWLDTYSTIRFLDSLVSTYVNLVLVNGENGNGKLMDLYGSLLKAKRICATLTLSRVAFAISCRLKEQGIEIDEKACMHYFIMQNVPFLVSWGTMLESSFIYEQCAIKIFGFTTEETFRMMHIAKSLLIVEKFDSIFQKSTRVALDLMNMYKLMDRKYIVICFQGFLWLLKRFCPHDEGEEPPDQREIDDGQELCARAAPLLLTVLQAVNSILESYRFSWSEALEGICLAKVCYWLLFYTNLPTKTVVLTLQLTRYTIEQCMPPSLVLLVDKIEGTALEAIFPLLVKKLHDPNWEVRDSALEVVAVVANLAEEKYPIFQDVLLSHKLGTLALAMLEGDSEGYVRASAIKVIMAMIPIDKLWVDHLDANQVSQTIQNVLKKDAEAIVRREAALMMSAMWSRCGRLTHIKGYNELVESMIPVTLNDLHWEVRVNALSFWSTVIELTLQRQGMVDGVFPPVTFSKQHKIVHLTENEIKDRLLKVLDQLSDYGCLTVLLAALEDDFDEQVVDKAEEVTSRLMDTLKLYHVIPKESGCSSGKRKTFFDGKCQQPPVGRTVSQTINSTNSDDVIDEIINSQDLNLLKGVMSSDSETVQPAGSRKFEKVSAESFLEYVQPMDLSRSADQDPRCDLATLLNDVLVLHSNGGCDTVPDCY